MYRKKDGTAGIRGQLYESKLLSLLYFRAVHDNNIESFHLATNIDKIGAFDDICFKAKFKEIKKPLAVFVQVKHSENDKPAFNNKNDLAKYFDSFLKIKHAFKPKNKDAFFDGIFDETECFFAMYMTAKYDFKNNPGESSYARHLYNLIGTGGSANQPYKNPEDVEFLCKIVMKEEITSLAKLMVKFIYDEGNIQIMLDDDLILRYHVILAQKVLHVSEIEPEGYRTATFRQDFFDTYEEFLVLFKGTLYVEIFKNRKLKEEEGQKLLANFLEEPSDVTILSKLIGTVVTYNSGQLKLINQIKSETLEQQLKQVYVPQSAVENAAKYILCTNFKVPASFGNKDLTISDAEIESRLFDLLDNSKPNNIVTLDESLGTEFLRLSGGIASAAGNILVHDEETKLMKFTDNRDLLGDLAKRLFDNLTSKIPNLHEYKFKIKVNKFPKLSLDYGDYEESLAREFLNKLVYYTNQAHENDVEKILKSEIEIKTLSKTNDRKMKSYRVKSDAIFLQFHHVIQKWWMKPKKAPYLTNKINKYEDSIKNIVDDPLMSVIHAMYMNKIKLINFTYSAEAVSSLKLDDKKSKAVIVTETSTFTVVKVMQCLNKKDHVVLDVEYIINRLYNPEDDDNELEAELKNTNKTLVLVCDKIQDSVNGNKTLESIAVAVENKNTIIVTNRLSVETLKQYFLHSDNIVYDERNNLVDLSEESQRSILKHTRVIFQGEEVTLDLIVDDESKACIEGDVLNKIINDETIVLGKPFRNCDDEELKYLLIERRVKKTGDDKDILLESFHDISNDVVIVTATPGMGKSTLLTQLSIKTKELNPEIWILRVNLLEYSKEFSKWKDNKTVIDSLETLNFMCQVILRDKLGKNNKVEIALEEANGNVYLRECTGDLWTTFELKLFLHYHNKGTLIFLFDGFDEICPHYTNEVMQCLKTVKNYHRKHRMWVTSRSYNDIKTMLQREFGTSYEIDSFTYIERDKYLETFWRKNLKLKDFNSDQLENVRDFLAFMSQKEIPQQIKFPLLFHIYVNGGHFLVNEIKSTYLPLWSPYSPDFFENCLKSIVSHKQHLDQDENPLHLYLIADYFIGTLLEVNKKPYNWNPDINTFTIYERFLETKLLIQFQEKNAMDMYNPDIIIFLKEKREQLVTKHKMLAAYSIFRDHIGKLLNRNQLDSIKDTIRFIKKGGEKTGLIHSIENNIPMFDHKTFAEYFAVDYLCDILKKEESDERIQYMIDLIFNKMFSMRQYDGCQNVRQILDLKMKIDKGLMKVFYKNKKVIFDCLIANRDHFCLPKDHRSLGSVTPDMIMRKSLPFGVLGLTLGLAILECLDSYTRLFLFVLKTYLNADNFDDFITIVSEGKCGGIMLLRIIIISKDYSLIRFIIETTRKLHKDMGSVFSKVFLLPPSINYDIISDDKIFQLIIGVLLSLGHMSLYEYIDIVIHENTP